MAVAQLLFDSTFLYNVFNVALVDFLIHSMAHFATLVLLLLSLFCLKGYLGCLFLIKLTCIFWPNVFLWIEINCGSLRLESMLIIFFFYMTLTALIHFQFLSICIQTHPVKEATFIMRCTRCWYNWFCALDYLINITWLCINRGLKSAHGEFTILLGQALLGHSSLFIVRHGNWWIG